MRAQRSNLAFNNCHPERSEGSAFLRRGKQILRVAQDDNLKRYWVRDPRAVSADPIEAMSLRAQRSNLAFNNRHPEHSEGSALSAAKKQILRCAQDDILGLSRRRCFCDAEPSDAQRQNDPLT